jgi:pilus assembly protein FimV
MFELAAGASPAATPESAAPVRTEDRGLDFKVDLDIAQPNPADESTVISSAASAGNDTDEEVQQKLELARAYTEMGDKEGAIEMLREAERDGNAMQQSEARAMRQALE